MASEKKTTKTKFVDSTPTNKLGGRATAKRVCHDCGKPTHNYRCNACWRKLRGDNYDIDLPEKDKEIRNL